MTSKRGIGLPATRAELLAAFEALPLADRARLGRVLADGQTTKAVGALTDAAVWEMSRSASYADVARELGVSVSAVNKAVTAHRKRFATQVAA